METLDEARQLAKLMVSIAHLAGRKAIALISDMNQPLGQAVGNALEVKEAIDTLQGSGPQDFVEHCLVVASHLLVVGGKAGDEAEGRSMAELALASGAAWQRFRTLVGTQGGDVATIDYPERLPKANLVQEVDRPQRMSTVDAECRRDIGCWEPGGTKRRPHRSCGDRGASQGRRLGGSG
jgi:pyrimidine-nucleoside phosphorylase